jgi:hypothetical protein
MGGIEGKPTADVVLLDLPLIASEKSKGRIQCTVDVVLAHIDKKRREGGIQTLTTNSPPFQSTMS